MRFARMPLVAAAVLLALTACAQTPAEEREAREAQANRTWNELREVDGVLVAGALPNGTSFVRLDYDLADDVKLEVMLEVRDILIADDGSGAYLVRATFDDPRELPQGSSASFTSLEDEEQFAAEVTSWLDVTASMAFARVEVYPTIPSVEVVAAVPTDRSVPTSEEVTQTVLDAWTQPGDAPSVTVESR